MQIYAIYKTLVIISLQTLTSISELSEMENTKLDLFVPQLFLGILASTRNFDSSQ